MKYRFAVRATAALFAASLLTGCGAYRAANARLPQWDPSHGYRPQTAQAHRPVGDVLLILAFSGGGTRAAAMSYGVLQELRDTRVTIDGEDKRLLDEVDLITSVSGGSFTSAYYALFGERIFEDFEPRFLRRNIQRQLVFELLRPLNWIRMAGSFFDRTELAVQLYDREVFDGATFADLEKAHGPFIQINAADLAVGSRFTFMQPQFDLICSDLSKFPVARAVAASSAVPGLFNAITLQNFAGTCGYQPPAWVDAVLADRRTEPRRFRYAKTLESYLDPRRKYIHLVDGGIADNIGIRGPLDNIILTGGLSERLQRVGISLPSHVVVIVVNSEVHPEPMFSYSAAAPGIATMLNAVSGTQIYSYNFETLELLRESMHNWTMSMPPNERGNKMQAHIAELAFDSLADETDRTFFNDIPTSFSLPSETIDRLIDVGRTLLRDSPEYQNFLAQLRQPAAPTTSPNGDHRGEGAQ